MKVILSKNAHKEFGNLSRLVQNKVIMKLKSLESGEVGKVLTGELKGYYSLRCWPYRIIYSINKKLKRIEIHKIAHRQGVYKR